MVYKEKKKLIPGQASKFVHDSGETKYRVGLDLPPGLPSGNPVTTEMMLRQIYSQLILDRTISPTSSQETAWIANDVLSNESFNRAWREYKRLRHQQVRSYRAAMQRWLASRALQRDRIIKALRSKVIYRKWSFFQLRFRADPGTDPGVEREEARGWIPMGSTWNLLNAVQSMRDSGSYRSGKSVRGRLENFLAQHVGYSSYIHAWQVFRTYRASGLGDCYVWVMESPLVSRVKQRRRTLSRGKIRYAKSDLYAGLSLWYQSNPRPARPGETPAMLKLKKAMTEAVMFHHMAHTRSGCFTLSDRRLLSVECDVGKLWDNHISLGETGVPGSHFVEFVYYTDSHPHAVYHRETRGAHRDDVSLTCSPDHTSRALVLPPQYQPPRIGYHRYIKPDNTLSDISDVVTFGDFAARRLAGLSGQVLDLATFDLSKDRFNLLRSTLELKDLPDTFKVLRELDERITDRMLPNVLEGRFGKRAVSRVTGGKLRLLSGLKLAIACHLSYKFGVEPTMQDVNTVLQGGQDWAISMKRAVRQLLAGMEDFASSLTLRKPLHIEGMANALPATVPITEPRLLDWLSRLDGARIGSGKYNFLLPSASPPQWIQEKDLESPDNWDLCALYGDPRRFEIGFYDWVTRIMRAYHPFDDLGLLHVVAVDKSSCLFMRLKAEAILDALGYDRWSSWLEDLAPLEVAWELVGLSFVVDWFTNTRRIVSNLQRKLQIFNDRFELGEQGIWYTLQVDHGIVDLQELPKRLTAEKGLHLRPLIEWSELANLYQWGYGDPCDTRLPQFGDRGSAYCWSGYQTTSIQVSGPPVDDIRNAMSEGLTVHRIASSTLRTKAALPNIWESAVPAFQLKIDFGKIQTLSELILSSFR